jgi:YfiH family protein
MLSKNINRHIHYVHWPAQHVLALTTTRQHPYLPFVNKSKLSKFSTFNLGDHVGDNPDNIISNRQSLLSLLPKNTAIQWFEQVHGSDVSIIESVTTKAIVADAAITREKNIALAIMTADCLPILLSTKQGHEIAAIHGGWRSLVGQVIFNTLTKMNASPSDVVAWLGPCIGADVFEVGEEVRQQFIELSPLFDPAFIKKKRPLTGSEKNQRNKYSANLVMIATLQLNQLGINNISLLPDCTFSNKDEYFSYRRDGQTGRMASIICRT